MKINFKAFRDTDTAEQIAKGLAFRPRDYILYKETIAFGGGLRGVRGGKAFAHRKKIGAVLISILQ